MRLSRFRAVCLIAAIALLAPLGLQAQAFSSGSNGSDGALNLTTPGTVIFDPKTFTPPLDPDGDNVYHFTSITIGPGVIVRLRGPELNMAPVFWLASGPVQIDGTIDLTGENGHPGSLTPGDRRPSIPGAGGYPGGMGGLNSSPQSGTGPGRGGAQNGAHGGGGGHDGNGGGGSLGGPSYGNPFLTPLLGGSGGGGGATIGGGGGAGGGAILIASSVSIAVNGSVVANAGSGGPSGSAGGGTGGGGSGGAIHLLAPTISGSGMLRAGGAGGINNGAPGRIRVEAVQQLFTGSSSPTQVRATPFNRALAPAAFPSIRVVSVDGVPVTTDSTGNFTVPDVTINKGTAATVLVEARNIPLGTVAEIRLMSEGGTDQIVQTSPLAGTSATSTATASITFPPGFSRGFVRAAWTP